VADTEREAVARALAEAHPYGPFSQEWANAMDRETALEKRELWPAQRNPSTEETNDA